VPKGSGGKAVVAVLTGETLDLRMLVDRPVVEIFVNTSPWDLGAQKLSLAPIKQYALFKFATQKICSVPG
jgi:hypothetical protein